VALEDDPDRGARRLRTLVREKQAITRRLERGRALEAVDAVVGERTLQICHETIRQALRAGIQRAQERVEVLLRAAGHGGVPGMGAAERAQVGVELEQPALTGRVGCSGAQPVEDPPRLRRGDVVAKHKPSEAFEQARISLAVGLATLEVQALSLTRLALPLERLDHEQRSPGGHMHVGRNEHVAHAAGNRRGKRGLHLHALRHCDHIPGSHLVAGGHRDRHHHARAGTADQTALVARDAVRHAVDFDQQVRVLQRGQGPV
jgi:hypothetical protein